MVTITSLMRKWSLKKMELFAKVPTPDLNTGLSPPWEDSPTVVLCSAENGSVGKTQGSVPGCQLRAFLTEVLLPLTSRHAELWFI